LQVNQPKSQCIPHASYCVSVIGGVGFSTHPANPSRFKRVEGALGQNGPDWPDLSPLPKTKDNY